MNEGNLSLLRAFLVRSKTLINIAQRLKVDHYIVFNLFEIKDKKLTIVKLLGNTLEALIGAIYIDSDIMKVRQCILLWYRKCLLELKGKDTKKKDYKSQMQEYFQYYFNTTITYSILDIRGKAHTQEFIIKLNLKRINKAFKGSGKSKKEAEQNIAKSALTSILF
jgi:ribonuclease-3